MKKPQPLPNAHLHPVIPPLSAAPHITPVTPHILDSTTHMPTATTPILPPTELLLQGCCSLTDDGTRFTMRGIHPWQIENHTDAEIHIALKELTHLASSASTINTCLTTTNTTAHPAPIHGIGEIGLDFSPKRCSQASTKDRQIKILKRQLEIATKAKLPITLHAVQCWSELSTQLKEEPQTGAIIFHQYSGSAQMMQQLAQLGNCYFSFSPTLLFTNKKNQIALESCPLEKLLLEDENRDNLEKLYYEVAKIKKIALSKLLAQIRHNIQQIFTKSL